MKELLEKLAAKMRDWNQKMDREYNRSLSIRVLVEIPYTPGNEEALRNLTCGAFVSKMTVALPVPLERVAVRVVGNPNWRR
jgi:hypothetical protein